MTLRALVDRASSRHRPHGESGVVKGLHPLAIPGENATPVGGRECRREGTMRLRNLVFITALVAFYPGSARAEDGVDFFEKKIRPVFAEHCSKCHSSQAGKLKGGLR